MKRLPSVSNYRVICLYLVLVFLLGSICVRAGYLYFNEVTQYSQHGNQRSLKTVTVPATKGIITDRNGEVLAITTVLYSLIVDLNHLRIKPNTSKAQVKLAKKRIISFKAKLVQLASIIKLSPTQIQAKIFLQPPKKIQIYLAKNLEPQQVDQIAALKISALVFERKLKRYYPHGEILANIIGFSDYVDVGRSGIEQSYDKYLRGQNGKMWLRRDRIGDVTAYIAGDNEFKKGKNLALTIDAKIQNLAFFALQKSLVKNSAKSGVAVVLNAKTGDILAMVNVPSYNTNDSSQRIGETTSNIALQELFEPGSIIKPFVVLAALESQVANQNTNLYLGTTQPKHQIKIADRLFKDTAQIYKDNISIATMLQKSSNVGAINLGLKVNSTQLIKTFTAVGFGKPINIDMYGGHFTGLVPQKPSRVLQASLSIGYGLNANVLQMARAYSVLANQGKLVNSKLILQQPTVSQQVVSQEHAALVANWLKAVVNAGGTAPLAKIKGFEVAGKTGTTLLSLGKKGYAKQEYVASFIGFAPFDNPKLIVAVLIQQPKGKEYYGGKIAAPVFAEITSKTLHYLGVRSTSQRSLTSVLQQIKS